MHSPRWILLLTLAPLFAQDPVTVHPTDVIVRPTEIDDVLTNPGMGFMTFQRFNGDQLNEGLKWTEGFPIVYQPYQGSLTNKDHPDTSIAYFRIYWRYLEPERDKYNWDLFDNALKTAHDRGQTLMVRIAPYGSSGEQKDDVPDYFRALVGEEKVKMPIAKWRTDPERPLYAERFGALIRAFGKRYDGHPDLESVDLAIVGAWGEGAGADQLIGHTREALVDAYLDSFKKTPLVMLLTDEKTNKYAIAKQPVGWRVDCLGDMGGFSKAWNHMYDYYPEAMINFGMRDAWQKAPVSFEVCWVMGYWKEKGWDVDYIIDQSLKWHISSFNGKSSAVPPEWKPQVDRWLKRMGYRFVLRKFTYPSAAKTQGKLDFATWWENKGVAPTYRPYTLALRLKSGSHDVVLPTDADVRTWLPGDVVYDNAVFVPAGLPAGEYDIQIALLDPVSRQPKVKLAIAGIQSDGWYQLGKIKIAE